jgi:hypothetical protein
MKLRCHFDLALEQGGETVTINENDWIDKMFQRKRKELDDEAEARDSAKHERRVFDSLIDDFWESFKNPVRSAVESYNQHIEEPHKLKVSSPSADVLHIEKNTQPFLRMDFTLNRPAQFIKRTEEFSSVPIKTMLIGIGKNHLYLNRPKEDPGAGQIMEQEIAQWVMGDIFAKLIGLKPQ